MATRVFTSHVEMQNVLESLIEKAVSNACDILLEKLQELIMSEYYDIFDTDTYSRTYQFYKSAMSKMLSKTAGEIFMNPDKMDYPFSGRGWAWTGELQISEANIGSHGGWTTPESVQHRYWEEFETYCDRHALKILKQELTNIGLKVV